MTHIILTLAVVLSAPNDPTADDATAADLRKMQSDWMVATMKVNGKVYPDDQAQVLFRTIEGNKYTITRFSKVIATGTSSGSARVTARAPSRPTARPDRLLAPSVAPVIRPPRSGAPSRPVPRNPPATPSARWWGSPGPP